MLRNDIGINAGIIWHLLGSHGRLSLQELAQMTTFGENILMLSLGWLARENKIMIHEEEGTLYMELIQSSSELYY